MEIDSDMHSGNDLLRMSVDLASFALERLCGQQQQPQPMEIDLHRQAGKTLVTWLG
jgi:hypothetical protein